MSKELVPTPKPGKSVSLKDLQKAIPLVVKETKKARLAKLKEPLSYAQIRDMQVALANYSDIVAAIDVQENRALTNEELEWVEAEYRYLDRVLTLAQARRERIKSMSFNHISAAEGEDSPGSFVVGNNKFAREGGGVKDPSIDLPTLKRNFSPEELSLFVNVRVTESVDESALEDFLATHPQSIELVREALIPGGKSPFRFVVRELKSDDARE